MKTLKNTVKQIFIYAGLNSSSSNLGNIHDAVHFQYFLRISAR